jgi:hypothetical protein
MASSGAYRCYLIRLSAFLVAIAGIFAALLVIGDPAGILGTTVVRGLNDYKPGYLVHEYAYKTAMMARQHPTCIAVGSSKIGHGIDVAGPGWACAPEKRLNLGLGASDLPLVRAYLNTARANGGLTEVVLGLDFGWFVKDSPKGRPNFEGFSPFANLTERLAVGLSPEMVPLAFSGILGSARGAKSSRDSAGRVTDEFFQAKSSVYGGYRGLFLSEIGAYGHYRPKGKTVLELEHRLRERMRLLRDILISLSRQDLSLHVFTTPTHAWELEAIHILGLGELHDLWKTQLATLAQEVGNDGKRFLILDFDTYSTYSVSPVPMSESESNPWYWESTHFRKTLGDLVLERLLRGVQAADPLFGVSLEAHQVERHLKSNHAARVRYLRERPTEIADLEYRLNACCMRR